MPTAVEEAPGTVAPEASPSMVVHEPFTPAMTGEMRWEREAEESPSPEATPVEQGQPATTEPEPSTPRVNLSEVPEAELDEWLKSDPRWKSRVDQLANNRLGNRLQEEREAIKQNAIAEHLQMEKAWTEATEQFESLEALADDDPEEYQRTMRDSKVANWRARYLAWAETREQEANAPAAQPGDKVFRDQFSQAFNQAAIEEFGASVKELMPYYGELSDATRKAIESAQYDPSGNWFVDSLDSLIKGLDQRWERKLKSDIEAARQAGRNEAMADREEDAPVVVGSQGRALSDREMLRKHAAGELELNDVEKAGLYKRLWGG